MKKSFVSILKRVKKIYTGPWSAHDEALDGDLRNIIRDDNGSMVAIVYGGNRNANLMAAAPDLLAALEHTVEMVAQFKKAYGFSSAVLNFDDHLDLIEKARDGGGNGSKTH